MSSNCLFLTQYGDSVKVFNEGDDAVHLGIVSGTEEWVCKFLFLMTVLNNRIGARDKGSTYALQSLERDLESVKRQTE